VDMGAAVAARARIKASLAAEGEVVPSFNDMVVKACGIALKRFPRANGAYKDGRFELYSRINVGIAVAAEDALVVPTIFDAAEKSGMGAAAFVGKQKLEHIAHPGSVDVFSRSGYFCKKVVEEAAEYLVDKRPQIEFIHFSDPDDLGHSDGWMSNPQLEAVRHTDRCLHTLLDAVSAAGLDRDTLFIISADHGGHGHNHSGKIKEDRLIPWIAWGPGVRAGHRITSPISTVDTAATTLWVLGYPPTPGAIGHPVFEAFDAATIAASGPKTKTIPF